MKNIHVLPTDIFNQIGVDHYGKTPTQIKIAEFLINKNIYITSPNEDINENDYIITKDGRLVQVSYLLSKDIYSASKVTLATDVDLIKDGVQAIDDEFLEWFVKNPSCEEVEVMPIGFEDREDYLIIIPKEETKQETLEEAAEKLTNDFPALEVRFNMSNEEIYGWFLEALQKGAKWQQERMYSEEEVIKILLSRNADLGIIGKTSAVVEFIKQFKKK